MTKLTVQIYSEPFRFNALKQVIVLRNLICVNDVRFYIWLNLCIASYGPTLLGNYQSTLLKAFYC